MARLLVSVRSADEARAAVAGGAAVIDVKEPRRGPLGRADAGVWSDVRSAVPARTVLSVALGELNELEREPPSRDATIVERLRVFTYRKVGLAGAGAGWETRWARLRRAGRAKPAWIAVVYADWRRADAPPPEQVVEAAIAADDCAGLLVDTWDKSVPTTLDLSWRPLLDRVRGAGRLIALAGGLNHQAIERLASLRPDLFAVRGAACANGDRNGSIDPERVSALARFVAQV